MSEKPLVPVHVLEQFRLAALQYLLHGGGLLPDQQQYYSEASDEIAETHFSAMKKVDWLRSVANLQDAKAENDFDNAMWDAISTFQLTAFTFGVQVGLLATNPGVVLQPPVAAAPKPRKVARVRR